MIGNDPAAVVSRGWSFDLTGRVALVTGASSGIGERFARVLAAAGAKVVLAARRLDRLEAVARQIAESGGSAHAVAMDATSEPSTIAAFDAAERAFGPIDTIVANAGTSNAAAATEMAVEAFDQTLELNLRGAFLTAREGARRLLAANAGDSANGRVVLMASVTAAIVNPGLAAYSATKAGIVQLGRVLAREWVNRGVNVNTLCPGYIRTEFNSEWFDTDGGKRQIAGFARRRLMDPGALDAMLLFLCSDASAAVTGAAFTIDDGQSL